MGVNTFHLSVIEDNINLTKMLISTGSIIIDNTDCFGRNALHYAAANGSTQMAIILMQAGINPNTKNNALETPLMKACQFIELDMIRFLIEIPIVDIQCRDTVGYYFIKEQ